MTRLLIPFEDWPEADKATWQTAIRDGDVLDGRGPATNWRPATRASNIEHYGRWLSFLARHDLFPAGTAPADRVTKDHVRTYVDELLARVAPCTVTSVLVGLKVTIKAMAPDHSWRWLADKVGELRTLLDDEQARPQAMEVIRSMIDRIEVHAGDRRGRPEVILVGALVPILTYLQPTHTDAASKGDGAGRVLLVAGARNQLYLLFTG